MQKGVKMSEIKIAGNELYDKLMRERRHRVWVDVVRPMQEQLKQQLEAVCLDAAKRFDDAKEENGNFVDLYLSSKLPDGTAVSCSYLEDLRDWIKGQANSLACDFRDYLEREYDAYWSDIADQATAAEVRAERKEFEERNRSSFEE